MPENELKIQGLEHLILALEKRPPTVRIGILAGGHRAPKKKDRVKVKGNFTGKSLNSAPKEVQTNAEIGACHEFGTSKLPIRSFLRMPLTDYLYDYLVKNKAFDKEALEQVAAKRSLTPWMEKVAVTAEEVVQEAFDSGGFGKWRPSDMTYKKVMQTLIETQQLRNSITSEVIE